MMKTRVRQDIQVLTSLDGGELSRPIAKKVLLCGEAVFTAFGSNVQPPIRGFVAQPPRETVSGFLTQFEKTPAKLCVWMDGRLLNLKKVRFAFAVDGYLAWGLRQRRKGVLVLLGGATVQRNTNIEIFVFVDGRLAKTMEKVLPATSDPAFIDTRDGLLAELRTAYPTGHFVQAAPLENWNVDVVEYVGDAPLKRLSFKPATQLAKQRSAIALPAMIAAGGLAAYVGFFTLGWEHYNAAQSAYQVAIQDPAIHEKGGIDTNFLDIMNARRIYMETPRRQVFLVGKAEKVIRGIAAIDRVNVIELRLPAPSVNPQAGAGVMINPTQEKLIISPDRSPDVSVQLSVPKADIPALTQGKNEVLEGIAKHTGMSVRIAQQGISEDKGMRLYNIEGFFHD